MSNVKDLYDFIDQAETDRNYAPNTAIGRRSALQLYEKHLNEEEKASLEVLENRLDRISQVVDSKSKGLKTNTLIVYKRRMRNLLHDFKKYDANPTARAGWRNQKPVGDSLLSKVKRASKPLVEDEVIEIPLSDRQPAQIGDLHDLHVQLRPDLRLAIPLPYDLSAAEANRLKKLIDSMVIEVDNGASKG